MGDKVKILDILDLKEISKNNGYFIVRILFSILFSFALIIGKLIVFRGIIGEQIDQIYFNEINFKHIILLPILSCYIFIIISLLGKLIDKAKQNFYKKEERKFNSLKSFLIIFFIILVAWLPYILSYFPGGIFGDTNETILQILERQPITNQHPILYLAILLPFVKAFKDLTVAMGVFTIVQILLILGMISCFINYLYCKNISLGWIIFLVITFSFFSLYPYFAITIWKDTIYSIAILYFTFIIMKIVISSDKENISLVRIIEYALGLFFVAFGRGNGFYVAIATTIILFLIKIFQKKFQIYKKMMSIILIEIVLIIFIQGPIFSFFNWNTEWIGKLGIPLQQVAYVISTDGNIDEEERQFLEKVMPFDEVKKMYRPCQVDYITRSKAFNKEFLKQSQPEFLKVYRSLFLKNKLAFCKAYLLETLSFWNPFARSEKDCYISPEMDTLTSEYFPGTMQYNCIEKITGISIRKNLLPKLKINAGVFCWSFLLLFVYCFKSNQRTNLLLYLPVLFNWATILIATPIAFSFRYIFCVVLLLPFAILFPYLEK